MSARLREAHSEYGAYVSLVERTRCAQRSRWNQYTLVSIEKQTLLYCATGRGIASTLGPGTCTSRVHFLQARAMFLPWVSRECVTPPNAVVHCSFSLMVYPLSRLLSSETALLSSVKSLSLLSTDRSSSTSSDPPSGRQRQPLLRVLMPRF